MLTSIRRAGVAGSTGRETPQSVLQLADDRTLVEDLKLPRGSTFDPIPAQLFRKCEVFSVNWSFVRRVFCRYIGYARKYVHPRLSEEAAKVLQVNFHTFNSL